MYLISQKRYIFGILMIEGIAHTTSQSEGNGNLTLKIDKLFSSNKRTTYPQRILLAPL